MATRSNISVKVGNKYKTIYCHWDGYLSHNGQILLDHYNTQELAEKLISNGDISSLAENCDKPDGHSFDNRIEGYTVYYGRDRGETDVGFKVSTDKPNLNEEFLYIFEDGKWYVKGLHFEFQELTQTLINKEDED